MGIGLPDIISDAFATLADLGIGFDVTFVSTTAGSYSTSTGGRSVSTSSETVTAVADTAKHAEIAAGLVQATDQFLLIAAADLTATPKPGDRVTVGTATSTVIGVETQPSGDGAATYRLHIRRA